MRLYRFDRPRARKKSFPTEIRYLHTNSLSANGQIMAKTVVELMLIVIISAFQVAFSLSERYIISKYIDISVSEWEYRWIALQN